jgi:release factor glutamine methyltransferase
MIAPRRPDAPPRVWTVADLLAFTESHFQKHGSLTPRLDAEVLLAHALGSTRLELYTGYRKVVEPTEREKFRGFVERRARGEPVAYITGGREFHSLKFEVSPAVLIPRPETEHLVDAGVEFLSRLVEPAAAETDPAEPLAAEPHPAEPVPSEPAAAEPVAEGGDPAGGALSSPEIAPAVDPEPAPVPVEVRVLDLGTGSGNIAVAIAAEFPGARVAAVDVSPEALAVARRNAEVHGVAARIEFLTGDLYQPLRAREPRPTFHAILSNPPYIPPRDLPGLPRDVKEFEPLPALLDRREGPDGDGLGFHRAIAGEAISFLEPGGLLAVEVGAGQAEEVEKILQSAGFSGVRSITDLGGIRRVILGESPAAIPPA